MSTIQIKGIDIEVNSTPQKININNNIPFELDAVDENVIKQVAMGVKNNQPVLIKGQTGVGKTSLIRHLANISNNVFMRINLNGSTGTDEVVGRWLLNEKGTFWVDGPLLTAMQEGYWLLVDEINAASPELDFVFHSLLDDDRFVRVNEKDGEIIKPHPNFRFFAAMNPHESGYAGTKELNPAFVSRFPIVVDYGFVKVEKELAIVEKQTGFISSSKDSQEKTERESLLTDLIQLANELRGAYVKEELSFCCSTRELISFVRLYLSGLPFDIALEGAILNKANNDEKKVIVKLASTILNYQSSTPEIKRGFSQKLKEFEEDKKKMDALVKKYEDAITSLDKEVKNRDEQVQTLNQKANAMVRDMSQLRDFIEKITTGKIMDDETMFKDAVVEAANIFKRNNI